MKPPMPTLLHGDARALPLPDASVDLVCCSPPYLGLRDYGADGQIGAEATPGEFLDALIACTREMVRVLKPAGSIWLNLGDSYARNGGGGAGSSDGQTGRNKGGRPATKSHGTPEKSLHLIPHRYAIRCIDELGLIVRQDQVWQKANPIPDSATDRTGRVHEYLFHLVKSPRYYSACDEIREPHQGIERPNHDRRHGALPKSNIPGRRNAQVDRAGNNPLGKLPGSVWTIPTQPLTVPAELGITHFAAFPPALIRPIILGWSPREVCTACGQGRRPVSERERPTDDRVRVEIKAEGRTRRLGATSGLRTNATAGQYPATAITGYACACPDTSAPSTPGVVLDPFSGTGTTAIVATMLGRRGIGVELNPDYIRLAQWRAADPKERARAAGLDPDAVAKVAPQLPGQESLFDGEAAS